MSDPIELLVKARVLRDMARNLAVHADALEASVKAMLSQEDEKEESGTVACPRCGNGDVRNVTTMGSDVLIFHCPNCLEQFTSGPAKSATEG
jgi:late competence protein required for DNA uptake (superfamily II DNA/RNA helicase)